MAKKLIHLIFFFTLITLTSLGNELKPNIYLLKDTIRLGEPFECALSFKHPVKMDVLFPDSTHQFSSFDFKAKKAINSISDSIFTNDSAVYTLISFNTKAIQKLSLPISILSGGDTIKLNSDSLELVFAPILPLPPQKIAFKKFTSFLEPNYTFNYPYYSIGLGIFITLLVLLFLIFRNTIKNRFTYFRLKKSHKKFVENYNTLKEDKDNRQNLEALLGLWKDYLQKIDKNPVSALTTKEISALYQNEKISEGLRLIDRAIYANNSNIDFSETKSTLFEFAVSKYQEEISKLNYVQ